MEEIKRQDLKLFVTELLRPGRLCLFLPALFFLYLWVAEGAHRTHYNRLFFMTAPVVLGVWALTARNEARKRKFYSSNYAMRWAACEDRLVKFEQVLKQLRREQVADLKEMPTTIRSVGKSVYVALRKADIVMHEIGQTELGGQATAPVWASSTSDPQSQALYRLADKNIAEYRAELAAVMAGVHRAEAQSAVFMTTLDSLRMKMVGYRLVGRRPELPSQDFLEALAEARLQLQSIDKALDELDLGHYPHQISVAGPPPMPADVVRRMEQNQ